MKIAVIGAGAMGCLFGLALKEAGAEVVLCDVWREHVDAINKNGLHAVRQGVSEYIKIPAVTDIKAVGTPDVVIIFTKSIHTESAVKEAFEIMGPETPVATFQNGLGNIAVIERYVGTGRIIAGITNWPSELFEPGAIRVEGTGFIKLGLAAVTGAEVSRELCRLLKTVNCEISDDIMKEIWEKLAFNNAMNLITSLTKQRDGDMSGSPYGFELCTLVAREVCDVAEAEGVNADYNSVLRTIERVADPLGPINHITSMLQDVLRMKPTEVDAICGAVIQKAAKHGINTPHLKTLFNMVKVVEENYKTQVLRL